MIQLSSALFRVQNSASVALEDSLVGFKGDGGRALGNGGLELLHGVINFINGSNSDLAGGGVSGAISVHASVGIILLRQLTVGLKVLHCHLGITSLAAAHLFVAIN